MEYLKLKAPLRKRIYVAYLLLWYLPLPKFLRTWGLLIRYVVKAELPIE